MNIINLGILAHVDAGKTTVTESLLYHCGLIKKMGKVDQGTTVTDSMELEQKRGMTIKSTTVSFYIKDTKINLIDTPGHMDFIAEVERSLYVLDGVILVISAKEGVQPQTKVIYQKLQELKVPTILFINKVDRVGVNLEEVYQQIKKQLSTNYILMQSVYLPGTKEFQLISNEVKAYEESILNSSQKLLEAYINEETLSLDDYLNAMKEEVKLGNLHPVFHGSALLDRGIEPLIEGIYEYFQQSNPKEEILSAYVYKIEWDEKKHKKAYIRMFSGTLQYREKVRMVGDGKEFTVKNLRGIINGSVIPVGVLREGDIGILYDEPEAKCGVFIGSTAEKVFPKNSSQPLLRVSIFPEEETERSKLLVALKELTEEDPELQMMLYENTGEISLRLYGKLQQEILQAILLERYKIKVNYNEIQTILMEQPIEYAEAFLWQGQSGNIYHAGAMLSVEPLPVGSGFVYENLVSYGDLEKSFQNAVLEGVQVALSQGVNGHEVTDVKVTFIDSQYDSVMGTPADFRKLVPIVVKHALEQATVRFLEPWLSYEVLAPAGCERALISDLTKRKGSLERILYEEEVIQVSGFIPLDTCKEFKAELLAYTEGKGIFRTTFHQYLPKS